MSRIVLASAALAVSAPLAAQDGFSLPPGDNARSSAWQSSQEWALTKLSTDPNWHNLDGLYWRRIAGSGTGAKPLVSDVVTVHYAGTLVDGTTFDSSFDRGAPARFALDRLITAWKMAIPQMGIGDTIEIVTPANLAYGPGGKGAIPGGATLMFTIQLLAIEAR